MTNPRIEKVSGDIRKTKEKIAGLQEHLRELEHKKTELENAEIVAVFRKEKLSDKDFAALVRQMSAERGTAGNGGGSL
ncbi:DUF4315 family protein [Ruminococcaceae bacterium OttesenSCG-928-L11]|nr:DUF4315 family protein [Ruminococcaceae bacterium OttesenSCG-928-L11]